jgi:hypothetical protein
MTSLVEAESKYGPVVRRAGGQIFGIERAASVVPPFCIPTDGRTVILSRHTEPEIDQAILLQRLKISLPAQPPPRVAAGDVP